MSNHQIIYYLHRAKEITNKIYNSKMNLIQIQYKVYTIFMNSKHSKASELNRLILKSNLNT